MPTATLPAKGQVTIPLAIRKTLKLRPGDKLEFVANVEREAVLRPATRDIRESRGLFAHKAKRPVTTEEMNEAIRRRGGRMP